MTTSYYRMQQRRGTEADLLQENDVPLEGEWVVATDTGKAWIGDGATALSDITALGPVTVDPSTGLVRFSDPAGSQTATIDPSTYLFPDSVMQALQNAFGGSGVSNASVAKNPDLLIVGAITRDTNDVIATAAVTWPDGTQGTFTTDTVDASGAISAYHITYGSNPVVHTYTQPTITRDSSGAATNVPQIVVS
jgi:hypothetical protein